MDKNGNLFLSLPGARVSDAQGSLGVKYANHSLGIHPSGASALAPSLLWRLSSLARARPKFSEAILWRHQRVAGDLAFCAACGDYTPGGED